MEMGIVMKKLVLAAAVLAVTASSALAADMAVKAKAPPPAPFDPWDLAFGSAIMNDYLFRGVTQSNHKPSVAVYFEPRYNFTKDLQGYIGLAGESISFPNRAAAEIGLQVLGDRKSTRLNSSHLGISYAVFCLKKKTIDSEHIIVCNDDEYLT